ncbi:MAG: Hpt domain-containing protein [Phycisphaerales bacterium]
MGDVSGFSLLELFKLEAEAHCAALGDGLLALERHPVNAATVESLMRAAHSIKGAARIVGLDVIVKLAHAMEDRFLTAQRGAEPLEPARVDQLLRGVDLFNEVRALPRATWRRGRRRTRGDRDARGRGCGAASREPGRGRAGICRCADR